VRKFRCWQSPTRREGQSFEQLAHYRVQPGSKAASDAVQLGAEALPFTRHVATVVSGMSQLAPGLIVAAPPLGDPNFDRSVVLLASHGPEGAFGWIINGRELMPLSELLKRAEVTQLVESVPGAVRMGGPVSSDQVWLVYRVEDRFDEIEGQFTVGSHIMATASKRVLEALAKGAPAKSIIGFAGYAGWAPTQLENEIRQGAWLPTDLDLDVVFDVPREQVWERALGLMGATAMSYTARTVGSA
jgi:putative transcriptional regulator